MRLVNLYSKKCLQIVVDWIYKLNDSLTSTHRSVHDYSLPSFVPTALNPARLFNNERLIRRYSLLSSVLTYEFFIYLFFLFYTTESSGSELEDDESVQEGVYYLLKELAFIIAGKDMFRTNKIAVIYHRSWPVYEKFVNGDYDGEAKEGLGLAIINYAL